MALCGQREEDHFMEISTALKTNMNETKIADGEKIIGRGDQSGERRFEEDCLNAHNRCRAKHGVPPLVLSREMCAYSKEWADHLASTDTFAHRKHEGRKYGENIFMKWSSDPNHAIEGSDPVDSWYAEIKDHVFGKEPTSLKSGHFTQVVWRESSELGVARAQSQSGKILVVANYYPAGNFLGKFTQNVPPPKH